jgi:hypothetical protein
VRNFFLAHTAGNLPGVPLDASDYGMGVGTLLCPLVELLDHDDLLPCLTALQQECDLDDLCECALRGSRLATDLAGFVYWAGVSARIRASDGD